MKLELRGNPNYCASIVSIENIIPLAGKDRIVGTMIQGNHVIVGLDVKVGDIGVYFPTETSIKAVFLNANNLFRESIYNVDPTKKGFFELNGRVRCLKLGDFKSAGFYMPLESLNKFGFKATLETLKVGTDFDHIDDEMICDKYMIKQPQDNSGSKENKAAKRLKRISKLVEGQFHFHIDTNFLAKNMHKINRADIISITEKVHGTSAIAAYVLCNKQLTMRDRIAKVFGASVNDKEYDFIWASRKVVKNQYVEKKNHVHFYSEDIWKIGADEQKPYVEKGMTVYYEIVGFLADGGFIQKGFDYNCDPNEHEKYIYRITSTNADGKVLEWSMLQVQLWCNARGLKAVPLHFYGRAEDAFPDVFDVDDDAWREKFLKKTEETYLEQKCFICRGDLPNEGIVLRRETLEIDVYKFKSFAFKARETK